MKSLRKMMGIAAQDKEKNENSDLEVGQEERKLVQDMVHFLEKGDDAKAVTGGIRLIELFPGGKRAYWAEQRLWEIYLKLHEFRLKKQSKKQSKKQKYVQHQILKKKLLRKMSQLPVEYGAKWIGKLFYLGQYESVEVMATGVLNNLIESPLKTKTLLTVARSMHFSGKYNKAYKYYKQLIEFYGGTWESVDAYFRMGIVQFRRQRYSSALFYFERLLLLPNSEDYNLSARYWIWNILKKEDKQRAQKVANDILRDFPITYYGLKVRYELEKKIRQEDIFTDGANNNQGKPSSFYLFSWQKRVLQRVKILAEAGWLQEARKELQSWPIDIKIEDSDQWAKNLFLAKVYRSLLLTHKATYLIRQLEGQAFRQKPLMDLTYPDFFKEWVDKHSQNYSLSPLLVKSLIRQESHWYVEALSSANAMGLMQMIPPTAKDIMGFLKIKGNLKEVLFDPQTNIRMGTYYLSKQVKKFKGYIPAALAAYNVGPTRLNRWLKSRSDTKDNMLWVDEMPWKETRGYVKGILRNMIIYKVLDEKKVSLEKPIWQQQTVTQ